MARREPGSSSLAAGAPCLAAASGMVLAMAWALASRAATPTYDVEVVHTYPHDPAAFTEGLFYLNGYLYESTGLEQHSTIRKVRLENGKGVQQYNVPPQ